MPSIRTAALALALTFGVAPAHAHPQFDPPDVRQHVTTSAVTYVYGRDRAVYKVDVNTSIVTGQDTSGYSYLLLALSRCRAGTCSTPVTYLFELTTGTFTTSGDLKAITVTTPAWGKPMTLAWTGDGPKGDYDSGVPTVAGTVVDFATPWTSTAKVTILGVTCPAANVQTARHTTIYAMGFVKPTLGHPPLPAKWQVGAPTAATACRTGPK